MKIDQVIINYILEYPRLYKDIDYRHSREKVLEDLFFMNGNAMDWKDGVLQYNYLEENAPEIEYTQLPENYFNIPIFSKEKNEDDFTHRLRLKLDKPHTPSEICSKQIIELYPLCRHAAIVNIPDDIKLDWLEAALEICETGIEILHNPYKHAHFHYIKDWIRKRDYSAIKGYIENQLKYLYQAKKRIFYIKNQRK